MVDIAQKYDDDILFHFPDHTFVETAVGDTWTLEFKSPQFNVTSVAAGTAGARFFYSGGHEVIVGHTVENTTFADSNYNITDTVALTDGSTFYELDSAPTFTATGTGLFLTVEATVIAGTLDAAYKQMRELVVGDVVDELMLPKAVNNTIIEINATQELEDLATASVITVSTDTVFRFNVDITTDTRFVFTGHPQVSFVTPSGSTYTYTETGTQTLFSGNANINVDGIALHNFSGTCTLIESGGLKISGLTYFFNCALVGWTSLGTINEGLLLLRFVSFAFLNTGFTTDNTIVITTEAGGDFATMTTQLIRYFGAEESQLVLQANSTLGTLGSEALFYIDAGIHADARVAILGGTVQGTELFDTTEVDSGAFISVADAAIAATTIDSVSGTIGVAPATFNFTVGPTVYVGQTVVVSGFTTNTAYNGTFVISAVAAGSFDIASVAFGTTEIGSFLSNSVTLTDLSHALSTGNTITVFGDDTIDYDGGFTVYNVTATTWEISATFVATETGTYTDAGLDQTDARVVSRAVTNFEDSHYIGTGFVNGNASATTIATNGVYVDIDFGALTPGSTLERFKIISFTIGEFMYTGNEAFDGSISFDFSVTSAGGTTDFLFKWQKDTGSGYVDLEDPVLALANVGAGGKNATKTFPLRMEKGDLIKPQVTRVSGASSITAEYATVYASQ